MTKLMDKTTDRSAERILVVDDEKSMREFMEIMLKKEGYDVLVAPSGEEGLDIFKDNNIDLVISDIKMAGMGGVEFLKTIKDIDTTVSVIMITAYASVDTAIEAMKAGAYDYFTKPFNIDDIKIHVSRALEWQRTQRENIVLKKDINRTFGLTGLIGSSTKMKSLYETIMSVSDTNTNVLISGESGTGKELTARAIHKHSDRENMPFVAINCGAIPETLIESELFGHEKGAFTGASALKKGLAELAHGGTLFLDEITELPLNMQVKLLRFIQERTFRRVGGTKDIDVDIRIIAASNRDVLNYVNEGSFREDLYYRLNVINVKLPALRERKEDIPVLVNHFIEKHSNDSGDKVKEVSEDAMKVLLDYDYPGNVRELENIIEASLAMEKGSVVKLTSLPETLLSKGSVSGGSDLANPVNGNILDLVKNSENIEIPESGMDFDEFITDVEKKIMIGALELSGGVKKKAAGLLGMSFRSFRYKAGKYKID